MGEIGHQHIHAPLAAAISPLAISPSTWMNEMRPDHNTGSYMPYSLRIVWGFFYVPPACEHSRVVRRGLRFIVLIREDLKVLTICGCNCKGSTFFSVILRPWALVRPESNSRPPAWQARCPTTGARYWQREERDIETASIMTCCTAKLYRMPLHVSPSENYICDLSPEMVTEKRKATSLKEQHNYADSDSGYITLRIIMQFWKLSQTRFRKLVPPLYSLQF